MVSDIKEVIQYIKINDSKRQRKWVEKSRLELAEVP